MKKILQSTNHNAVFYFVIPTLLVISLPQNCLASCNDLNSYADQVLCQNTASHYGVEEVELWRGSRNSLFSTIMTDGHPKLIVMERILPGDGQDVSSIEGVNSGKLVLQESNRRSKLPVLSKGTLIRLKRDSDKSRTRMLVLTPRSESREMMGDQGNSTMSSGDGGETSGVNPQVIVPPSAVILFTHLMGWLWTFIHIWDVYYYNGGGAEKLSVKTLVATAFCTFGLNLIPHFIIYKVKKPQTAPNPV